MSEVRVSIDIAAPPEAVWEVITDAARLHEWVTIHRKVHRTSEGPTREGYEMEQTLCLRGATFKVRWTLAEHDAPRRLAWEGRGPARSHARTEYDLRPDGDGGTHFDYLNEFRAPLGPLGAVASKALVGGLPEKEANASLRNLKALLER